MKNIKNRISKQFRQITDIRLNYCINTAVRYALKKNLQWVIYGKINHNLEPLFSNVQIDKRDGLEVTIKFHKSWLYPVK